ELTTIAASFFGAIGRRPRPPLVDGLRPPSSTHPAVGFEVVIGMVWPLAPRGTRRARRCTTDWRAASLKIGADCSGFRNPLKSAVVVGAVIAIGHHSFCSTT